MTKERWDEEHSDCEGSCVRHGHRNVHRRWTSRTRRADVLLLRLQVQRQVRAEPGAIPGQVCGDSEERPFQWGPTLLQKAELFLRASLASETRKHLPEGRHAHRYSPSVSPACDHGVFSVDRIQSARYGSAASGESPAAFSGLLGFQHLAADETTLVADAALV